MRFTLGIDCNNAAFEDDPRPEVGRLLEEVARALYDAWEANPGRLPFPDRPPLFDINGNRVGHWSFRM